MNLLPSIASSNIADIFTKSLPVTSHHRFLLAIGDNTTTSTTSVASTVGSLATVDPVSPTVVASTTVASASNSVPSLHPNSTLPIVLDTGSSIAHTPSALDFALKVTQASYGLFRSPISVVSTALASKTLTSTPVDPYALITGEDISVDSDPVDLLSPDFDSDLDPCFTKVYFDIRQFGTSTLTFIYSKSTSELLHIFLEPTQVDWLHWIPLPRLTPTESYFHLLGLDCFQALTLFHLIPIWIYLLHFVVNLD